MAAGGSGGALLAAPCADFIGRKWSMLGFGLLFIVGCAMQEIADLGVFYTGRLLAGLSIGATSMLAPQYLGENAPKSIRGSVTTSYNLCIILALRYVRFPGQTCRWFRSPFAHCGNSLAFWTNYGVALWPVESDLQWKLALAIQIIPGGFMFIMIWCKSAGSFRRRCITTSYTIQLLSTPRGH